MRPSSWLTALLVLGLVTVVAWLAFSPRPELPASNPEPEKANHSPSVPIPEIARREDLVGNRVVRENRGKAPEPSAPATPQEVQSLRERLIALHMADADAASPHSSPPKTGEVRGEDARLARYTRRIVEHHFAPLVDSCYSKFLETHPTSQGSLQLDLSIVGRRDLGAVVLGTELQANGSLNDPELIGCISEALMSAHFPAPPDGRTGISVAQSFDLSP